MSKNKKKTKVIRAPQKALQNSAIPPADELSAYDKIRVGFAEKILKMIEDQNNHRISIEKTVIERQTKQDSRGQVFAFFITMSILCLAGIAIFKDYSLVSVALVVSAISILLVIFIKSKKAKDDDLNSKK